MPVTVVCPHLECGRTVVAPDSARGLVVRCNYCGKPFRVPQRAEPERKPAPTGGQNEPAAPGGGGG